MSEQQDGKLTLGGGYDKMKIIAQVQHRQFIEQTLILPISTCMSDEKLGGFYVPI